MTAAAAFLPGPDPAPVRFAFYLKIPEALHKDPNVTGAGHKLAAAAVAWARERGADVCRATNGWFAGELNLRSQSAVSRTLAELEAAGWLVIRHDPKAPNESRRTIEFTWHTNAEGGRAPSARLRAARTPPFAGREGARLARAPSAYRGLGGRPGANSSEKELNQTSKDVTAARTDGGPGPPTAEAAGPALVVVPPAPPPRPAPAPEPPPPPDPEPPVTAEEQARGEAMLRVVRARRAYLAAKGRREAAGAIPAAPAGSAGPTTIGDAWARLMARARPDEAPPAVPRRPDRPGAGNANESVGGLSTHSPPAARPQPGPAPRAAPRDLARALERGEADAVVDELSRRWRDRKPATLAFWASGLAEVKAGLISADLAAGLVADADRPRVRSPSRQFSKALAEALGAARRARKTARRASLENSPGGRPESPVVDSRPHRNVNGSPRQ